MVCFSKQPRTAFDNFTENVRSRDRDLIRRSSLEANSLNFPMHVVPLQDFLNMTVIKRHEALKKEGVLVEFNRSMGKCIFVSHQWVARAHPDPNMTQLKVLQDALKNFLSGAINISDRIDTHLFGKQGKISRQEMQKTPLFIWYDYFCCPQDPDVTETETFMRRFHSLHLAVESIPAYVEMSRYFVILCPAVEHLDTGAFLSLYTWAERGWCRLERLARALSSEETAVVVIQSPTHLTLGNPFEGLQCSVGDGVFSVDQDRQRVAGAIEALLRNKMLHHLNRGAVDDYRLLLNLRKMYLKNLGHHEMRGLVPGFDPGADVYEGLPEILAKFYHQNGFLTATHSDGGWAPLCYAALDGDPELISCLLAQRADANEQLRKPKQEYALLKGMSALTLAAMFKNNEALEELLRARARPELSNEVGATPLHLACIVDNAAGLRSFLHGGHRSLADQRDSLGFKPLHIASVRGSKKSVQELLPFSQPEDLSSCLHLAAAVQGGSAEFISLLLEAKADVNERASLSNSRIFRIVMASLSLKHKIWPTPLTEFGHHQTRATPLIVSLLSGSFEAAAVLIAAGAKFDVPNANGKTAAAIASQRPLPDFLQEAFGGDPAKCQQLAKPHFHRLAWLPASSP